MTCKWGSNLLKIIYFLKIFYIKFNIIIFKNSENLNIFLRVFMKIFLKIFPQSDPLNK